MPLRFVIYPMQFPLLANHAKDTGLSVHGAQRLHGGINQLLDELWSTAACVNARTDRRPVMVCSSCTAGVSFVGKSVDENIAGQRLQNRCRGAAHDHAVPPAVRGGTDYHHVGARGRH